MSHDSRQHHLQVYVSIFIPQWSRIYETGKYKCGAKLALKNINLSLIEIYRKISLVHNTLLQGPLSYMNPWSEHFRPERRVFTLEIHQRKLFFLILSFNCTDQSWFHWIWTVKLESTGWPISLVTTSCWFSSGSFGSWWAASIATFCQAG